MIVLSVKVLCVAWATQKQQKQASGPLALEDKSIKPRPPWSLLWLSPGSCDAVHTYTDVMRFVMWEQSVCDVTLIKRQQRQLTVRTAVDFSGLSTSCSRNVPSVALSEEGGWKWQSGDLRQHLALKKKKKKHYRKAISAGNIWKQENCCMCKYGYYHDRSCSFPGCCLFGWTIFGRRTRFQGAACMYVNLNSNQILWRIYSAWLRNCNLCCRNEASSIINSATRPLLSERTHGCTDMCSVAILVQRSVKKKTHTHTQICI